MIKMINRHNWLLLIMMGSLTIINSSAVYAQEFAIKATASGPENNLTLSVNVQPDQSVYGLPGLFFVAAKLPIGIWVYPSARGWQQWDTNTPLPPYMAGTLQATNNFTPILNMDVSAYAGTTIYAGYGLDFSTMVKNGTYNSVYDVPGNLANCGTVPYPSNTGYTTPNPIIQSPQVWSFASEPQLHPMKVTVNTFNPGTSAGSIFLAPYAFSADASYGQQGSLISDNSGNPVWFRSTNNPNLMNTDFRIQQLGGKSVLTFWQGTLATPPAYTNAPAGSSEPGSCYYILDNSYRVIKTVEAQNGFTADIHEFLLTPGYTALLLSTRSVPMDLTPYGGPKAGYVQDFAIQEIDLITNKLLFFWDALNNIPLSDSYEPASSASSSSNIWDAYHLNSIGLTDNVGNIIVSGRNTSTIYIINKSSGKIAGRLGGKQSDFTIAKGAAFSWQHDARFLPNNVISMFDDNCCESSTVPSGTPPSHGLFLQLDLVNKSAGLLKEYYHTPNMNIASQGNTQSLANGNVFIGWGQSAYYSEYAAVGNTLYDAQMPGSNYTYRAYRGNWVGTPYYPPSIAVQSSNGTATVYASWNGSTETSSWQVFSGSSAYNLLPTKTAAKSGFETAISVTNAGPYFQVKALDASGKVIGESQITQ